MNRALFPLLLLALAGAAQAQLPARVEITYEVQRNGSKVAEMTGLLETGDGSYRLTETSEGSGIYALLGRARRMSEGALGKHAPLPREFTDERSGRDTARASFDWKTNTLTMSYKGKSRTEAIPPNGQDRLSFILALALAPREAKVADLHLVNGRGVSHHVYRFAGYERIKTPAGEFDTRKVVRGEGDDRTESWLATAYGGMPVRTLLVEDGNTTEQFATKVAR